MSKVFAICLNFGFNCFATAKPASTVSFEITLFRLIINLAIIITVTSWYPFSHVTSHLFKLYIYTQFETMSPLNNHRVNYFFSPKAINLNVHTAFMRGLTEDCPSKLWTNWNCKLFDLLDRIPIKCLQR